MDFPKRVGIVCRRIPRGRVATYGQIALLCGRPQCPRQVGAVLRSGSCGEVPAHRVLDRRGFLSGAKAFLTPDLQRLGLEAEGIAVSEEQVVDLEKYGWRPDPRELAELERAFAETEEEGSYG